MSLDKNHAERVKCIVRDMWNYASKFFEVGDEYKEDPAENPLAFEGLKYLLSDSVRIHRDEPYLHAFDHYIDFPDRVNSLKASMNAGVKELTSLMHMPFIRECSLYIMASVLLKQKGFVEAPEIAQNAIYRACMISKHNEYLVLWEGLTEDEYKWN